MGRQIRVLLAKPGLDGHDRGIKVIARTFREAGMEVIYLGLHQNASQIASAAAQEDADVVALSILSGAHVPICRKVVAALEDQGVRDEVVLIVGGTILEEDIPVLKDMGVAEVFPPGSPIDAGVEFIRSRFGTWP